MTIDVTRGWDYSLVHLDSGLIPLHKASSAHEIADAFREAAQHLEEVERREAARLDRGSARATNLALAATDAQPFGTSAPATTVTQHISIDAPCSCDCKSFCQACKPSAGDVA